MPREKLITDERLEELKAHLKAGGKAIEKAKTLQ